MRKNTTVKQQKSLEKESVEMAEMNPTNFIITNPTQMPYYCAKYQVLCGSHTWESHLNEKKSYKNLK
jgi:hypothetical protein